MFEATDENDFEVAMVDLRGGTHTDKDEKELSVCFGIYHGMSEAR